jgi:cell division transport system permease protein
VAVLTISIVLFAAGLARTGAQLIDSVLQALGDEVELTVYLEPRATEVRAQEIARALESRSGGVAAVITASAALVKLQAELGEMGAVLQGLPENPLPISIQLRLPEARRTLQDARLMADEARRMPLVKDADYAEEAVARLSAIGRALRRAGLVGFLVVGLATILIVAATLQLAIYSRREEIEIQKLVGATDRFVKVPFLIEGVLQGILGAGVAMVGVWAFVSLFGVRLLSLFSFLVRPPVQLSLLSPSLLSELLLAGALLGLSGSFVAVGRFLRR